MFAPAHGSGGMVVATRVRRVSGISVVMVRVMRSTTEGDVLVFTFKDGLLARAAHDLRLRVMRFSVQSDGESVEATFDASTLRVDGTVRGGVVDADELSDKDKAEIEKTARKEILEASRHPKIVFEGSVRSIGDRHNVRGELRLVGQRAPVELEVREEDGRLKAEVEITPSRWGIQPYKALLGAIKLRDRVRLQFDLTQLT